MSDYENYFDTIPDPSDEELLLLTAEEYLASVSQDPDAARAQEVARTDLQHEIDAQVELIDELVEDYLRKPDPGLDKAIEEAKISLGNMLVDRGNLPPA